MHSLKPKTPIDVETVRVVRDLQAVAIAHGIEFMMVGATARDILLQNVHGMPPSRATRDVDFAVTLPSWEGFEALRAALVATSRFSETRTVHRLAHRDRPGVPCTDVDLIPFGGLEHRPASIAWPPDAAVLMNVAGYADALAAAVTVEIAQNLEIKLASLPGITLLKIFAWADRGATDPRDATDLRTLLDTYFGAGNADRVYEEAPAVLEKVDYVPEHAAMWLLGLDAARVAQRDSRERVRRILGEERNRDRLAADMTRRPGQDGTFDSALKALELFRNGFESMGDPSS